MSAVHHYATARISTRTTKDIGVLQSTEPKRLEIFHQSSIVRLSGALTAVRPKTTSIGIYKRSIVDSLRFERLASLRDNTWSWRTNVPHCPVMPMPCGGLTMLRSSKTAVSTETARVRAVCEGIQEPLTCFYGTPYLILTSGPCGYIKTNWSLLAPWENGTPLDLNALIGRLLSSKPPIWCIDCL